MHLYEGCVGMYLMSVRVSVRCKDECVCDIYW